MLHVTRAPTLFIGFVLTDAAVCTLIQWSMSTRIRHLIRVINSSCTCVTVTLSTYCWRIIVVISFWLIIRPAVLRSWNRVHGHIRSAWLTSITGGKQCSDLIWFPCAALVTKAHYTRCTQHSPVPCGSPLHLGNSCIVSLWQWWRMSSVTAAGLGSGVWREKNKKIYHNNI